jgi:hypothetical protein
MLKACSGDDLGSIPARKLWRAWSRRKQLAGRQGGRARNVAAERPATSTHARSSIVAVRLRSMISDCWRIA